MQTMQERGKRADNGNRTYMYKLLLCTIIKKRRREPMNKNTIRATIKDYIYNRQRKRDNDFILVGSHEWVTVKQFNQLIERLNKE